MNLIEHVNWSIENANLRKSKISMSILEIEGMSGENTRHFYNNICSMKDARYLEIGTWKGSTVCAAMYGNSASVVCIDNWSEFGGPKSEFESNFNKFRGENFALFIESDCFKVNLQNLPKFNIFMYDGNHTNESHYLALKYYYTKLDDTFIYIVDDWNCESIRNSTNKSISDLGLKILYQKEIFTNPYEPDGPRIYNGGCDRRPWANGCGVFVLQKV